jgi:hypothetical protein
MKPTYRTKCTLAFVLGLLGLGVAPPASASVIVTTIGSPAFAPADFHLFSATLDFSAVLPALLPPPNHEFDPSLGIIPGAAHAGPYDTEIARGLATTGYHQGTQFTPAEYSGGNGVYLAYMLIPSPGGPIGSSPDFASGPIIPNSLFPIHVAFTTYQNGIAAGTTSDLDIPPTSAVGFPGVAGYSHIPGFLIDAFEGDPFAPSNTGSYVYRATVLDATGNGFSIDAGFEVVPEPSSMGLLVVGMIAISVFRVYRRIEAKRT